MTTDKLKNIFGRFQNLNLLFLIEDLRRGRVARFNWQSQVTKDLCPLAHGWSGGWRHCHQNPWELAGISRYDPIAYFPNRWDSGDVTRDELLSTLESLYAERLADADVMQVVCLPHSVTVDVPQAQAVAQ